MNVVVGIDDYAAAAVVVVVAVTAGEWEETFDFLFHPAAVDYWKDSMVGEVSPL
jgi:hypothetical protein